MRRLLAVTGLLLALLPQAKADDCVDAELCVDGFLAVAAANTRSPLSWLEGGSGRLTTSGEATGVPESDYIADLQASIDWKPSPHFRIHAHAVGRKEEAIGGRPAGVTELYVESRPSLSGAEGLRLRAGAFFLPSSRENVENTWSSPYSITLSAINSWIAEEVRPIGVDAEYRLPLASDTLTVAATGFGGNDSMGALLAWRGWAFGNRLSVLDEQLPLPPLPSLSDPAMFGMQDAGGTRPLGRDLDGRAGWSARMRWRSDRLLAQILHLDNRGDRGFHRGEYAWRTRYDLVALEWSEAERFTVAAEYLTGSTGMGFAPTFVQADLRAGYVLVSLKTGSTRFSIRYDDFAVRDRDRSAAENNDEDGNAWTASILWSPSEPIRVAVELVDIDGDRPAAAEAGLPLDTSSRRYLLELRYRF